MAVVFDFDDTLLPDSTTALLAAHGIDTDEFWKELAPALVAEGYDPPLAYLRPSRHSRSFSTPTVSIVSTLRTTGKMLTSAP